MKPTNFCVQNDLIAFTPFYFGSEMTFQLIIVGEDN